MLTAQLSQLTCYNTQVNLCSGKYALDLGPFDLYYLVFKSAHLIRHTQITASTRELTTVTVTIAR